MAHQLVWDIETKEPKHDDEGFPEYRLRAGVGLACVYNVDHDQYEFFSERNIEGLVQRLEAAQEVISYNGVSFDHVVLDAAIGRHVYIKQELDLWEVIRRSLDRSWPKGSWTLAAVCERTLGQTKAKKGSMAPQLLKDMKLGELITYNIRDVWLTRKLWEFLTTFGYVIDPNGEKLEIGEWIA